MRIMMSVLPDFPSAALSPAIEFHPVCSAGQAVRSNNRASGENVSRYVNRLRIENACRLMLQGQNVTAAMLDSGFNTKSNFNREFLRLKQESPSKWLEAQR
jgi:AraC-like DNA-binding protein